jgi:hypothetical protein
MEQLLEHPRLSSDNRIATLFALGKACEDAGDFARAFAFYSDGNREQRAHVGYDPEQTETLNDRIIDLFDEKFLAERVSFGHDDPAPIFIVGLPRSGSMLIEQILASHS